MMQVIGVIKRCLVCFFIAIPATHSFATEASLLGKLTEQQQQQCLQSAADYFLLSSEILIAIQKVEGAWTGAKLINKNKSIDHGIMGINSVWKKTLNDQGITLQQIAENDCLGIWVGAWILANYLHEAGAYNDEPNAEKYWRGVGYYNSHTTSLNEKYALKVWKKMIAQQQADEKENN